MNIFMTLVLFMTAACATSTPKWKSEELSQALEALSRGEVEVAGELLERACEKEIPGACLTLGLPEEIRLDYQLKIKQLETNERETTLLISSKEDEEHTILLWDQDNLTLLAANHYEIQKRMGLEGEKLTEITFSKLRPGGDYRLDVYNRAGQLLDSRFFSTLKTEGTGLLLAFKETSTAGVDAIFSWNAKDVSGTMRELKPQFGAGVAADKREHLDLVVAGPEGSRRVRLRGFDIYLIHNEGISAQLEAWLLDKMAKTRRPALLVGQMAWFKSGEEGFPTLMNKMKRQLRAPVLFLSPLKVGEGEQTQVSDVAGLGYQTYEFKLASNDMSSGLLLKTSLGKVEATLHNRTYQVEYK